MGRLAEEVLLTINCWGGRPLAVGTNWVCKGLGLE